VSRIDVEEGELTIELDGGELSYGFGELDELVLAYATTIHKSQGSEYPEVVIPRSSITTRCSSGTWSIRE
jgi:exodeoxyribonuclease V alpha subunit